MSETFDPKKIDVTADTDELNDAVSARHTTHLEHDDPLFNKGKLENSSGMIIHGKTTAPARKDVVSQETLMVTEDDLDEMCEDAVGRPIMCNHKASKAIGRVISAKPDADGRIEVAVEMENSVEGWRAVNAALNKDFIGFSWGARHFVIDDEVSGKAVADKRLVELSITGNPEFDQDALITSVSARSDMHEDARKRLREFLRNSPAAHREFGRSECLGTKEARVASDFLTRCFSTPHSRG
jgi:hypothetical protein